MKDEELLKSTKKPYAIYREKLQYVILQKMVMKNII